MPGKKQIFGNEIGMSVRQIAHRVLDRNKPDRRIQRDQRNGQIPEKQKDNDRVQRRQKLLRMLKRTQQCQADHTPQYDKYRNGKIHRRQIVDQKIIGNQMPRPLLYHMKKRRQAHDQRTQYQQSNK